MTAAASNVWGVKVVGSLLYLLTYASLKSSYAGPSGNGAVPLNPFITHLRHYEFKPLSVDRTIFKICSTHS